MMPRIVYVSGIIIYSQEPPNTCQINSFDSVELYNLTLALASLEIVKRIFLESIVIPPTTEDCKPNATLRSEF